MLKQSGMPRPTDRTAGGFTLVELMVALVIFSFVMLMLFSSFNAFVSTGQAIAQGADFNERARDAFRIMADDLTCVYAPQAGINRVLNHVDEQDLADPGLFQMVGSTPDVGGERFSRLEFSCLSARQTGRRRPAGVVRVIYYVRKNSRDQFDLCRAERGAGSGPVTGTETDPCRDPVLAENIAGFSIDFIDSKGHEHRVWDADTDTHGDPAHDEVCLPGAVAIGLTLKRESREKRYETAVVLPVHR